MNTDTERSIATNSGSNRQSGASRPRRRTPAAPKPPKPMSATQRNKLATQGIVAALGVTDEKAAITAALEAVHERLAWDEDLCKRIREKYKEIEALGTGAKKSDLGPMPPLIRPAGLNRQTPLHVLDPYELVLDYGKDQLRNVLNRATQKNLRVAVKLVQEHNPGTKPTDGTTNAGLVDYVVRYVVGPGY